MVISRKKRIKAPDIFNLWQGACYLPQRNGPVCLVRIGLFCMRRTFVCVAPACDAPTIQEVDLQAAVVQAINLALGNRESMMSTLQENIEAVIRQEDETSLEGIEAKLLDLQKELLKLANSKKDYNSVADEIDRLRELKQNALVESAEREGLKQRIREMREFLEQQSIEVTEYDELLVRRLIEKVTVYNERFEVEFKSGAKVDVGR